MSFFLKNKEGRSEASNEFSGLFSDYVDSSDDEKPISTQGQSAFASKPNTTSSSVYTSGIDKKVQNNVGQMRKNLYDKLMNDNSDEDLDNGDGKDPLEGKPVGGITLTKPHILSHTVQINDEALQQFVLSNHNSAVDNEENKQPQKRGLSILFDADTAGVGHNITTLLDDIDENNSDDDNANFEGSNNNNDDHDNDSDDQVVVVKRSTAPLKPPKPSASTQQHLNVNHEDILYQARDEDQFTIISNNGRKPHSDIKDQVEPVHVVLDLSHLDTIKDNNSNTNGNGNSPKSRKPEPTYSARHIRSMIDASVQENQRKLDHQILSNAHSHIPEATSVISVPKHSNHMALSSVHPNGSFSSSVGRRKAYNLRNHKIHREIGLAFAQCSKSDDTQSTLTRVEFHHFASITALVDEKTERISSSDRENMVQKCFDAIHSLPLAGIEDIPVENTSATIDKQFDNKDKHEEGPKEKPNPGELVINLKQVSLFCEMVMDLVDLSFINTAFLSPFSLMSKEGIINVIKQMKLKVQASGFGKYDADRRRHWANRLSRKEESEWSENINMKVYNSKTGKITMKTNKSGGNDKLRINKLYREVAIAWQEVDVDGDGYLNREQFNQCMHLMGIVDSVKGYIVQPSGETKDGEGRTTTTTTTNSHNIDDNNDNGDGMDLRATSGSTSNINLTSNTTTTARYIEDGMGAVDVTSDNLFSRRRQHSTHNNKGKGVKFGITHLPNPYDGRILSDTMVRDAKLDFNQLEPVYDQQNLDLVYRVFDCIFNLPTQGNDSGNQSQSDDGYNYNVIYIDQLTFYLKMLFGFLDSKKELEALCHHNAGRDKHQTISPQQMEEILKTLEECKYKKISNGYGKLDQKKREYHKTAVAEAKFQREVNTFQPILYAKSTVKKVLPSQAMQSKHARYRPGSGKYENHLRGTKAQPSRITLKSHLQPPSRDKEMNKSAIENKMQRDYADDGKHITTDAHLSIEADIDILQEQPLVKRSNAVVPSTEDVYLGSSPNKREVRDRVGESMVRMANRKRVPPPPPGSSSNKSTTDTSTYEQTKTKDAKSSNVNVGIECGLYSTATGLSRDTLPSLNTNIYYYNAQHPPAFSQGYYTLPPASPPPRSKSSKTRPLSPFQRGGSVSPQRTPVQMLTDSGFSVAPALPFDAWIDSHTSHHDSKRNSKSKRKFFNSNRKGEVKHNKHLLPTTTTKASSNATDSLPSSSRHSTTLTGWDAVIQEMRERKLRANKHNKGNPDDDGDSLRKGMLRPVKVGKLGHVWKHKFNSKHRGNGRGKTDYGLVIDELQYKLKQLRGLYKKDKKKGGEKGEVGSPSPSKEPRSPLASSGTFGNDDEKEMENDGTIYEPMDDGDDDNDDNDEGTGLSMSMLQSSSSHSISPTSSPQHTPHLSRDPYAAPATASRPAAPPLPPSWPPMLYKKLVKEDKGVVDSRPLSPSRSPERATSSISIAAGSVDQSKATEEDNAHTTADTTTAGTRNKDDKGHKWKVEKYFGICNGSVTPKAGQAGGFPAAFPTNTVYRAQSGHTPPRGRAGLLGTDTSADMAHSGVSFTDTTNVDNDNADESCKDGNDIREKQPLPNGFYIASTDQAVQAHSILSMGTVDPALLSQLQDMLQAKQIQADKQSKEVQRLQTEASFGNYKSKEAFYKSIQHLQKARQVREARIHRENLQSLRFYEHRRVTGKKSGKPAPPPIPASSTSREDINTRDESKDSNNEGNDQNEPASSATPTETIKGKGGRVTEPKPFHLHTDYRADAKTRLGTSRQLPTKSFIEREGSQTDLPLSYFGVKGTHNVSEWQHVDVVSSPTHKTRSNMEPQSRNTNDDTDVKVDNLGSDHTHNHEQIGNNLSNAFFASKLRDKETGFHHKLPDYDTDAPNTTYTEEPKLRVTSLIARKAEAKRQKAAEEKRLEKERKRKEKEYKEGLYQKAMAAARKRGVRSALDEYMDSQDVCDDNGDNNDDNTTDGGNGDGNNANVNDANDGDSAYLWADDEIKHAAERDPVSPGSVPDSPLMLELQQGMRALKEAHSSAHSHSNTYNVGNPGTSHGHNEQDISPIRVMAPSHKHTGHSHKSHTSNQPSYAAHVYAQSQRVHRAERSKAMRDRRQERVSDYILHSQRGGQKAKRVSEKEYQSTINRLYYGKSVDAPRDDGHESTEIEDAEYLDFMPQFQYQEYGHFMPQYEDHGSPTTTTVGTPSTEAHTPPTPPVEVIHNHDHHRDTPEQRHPMMHFNDANRHRRHTKGDRHKSYDPYYHHQLLSKHQQGRVAIVTGKGGTVSPSAGLPPPPSSPPQDVDTPHKIVHAHDWKEFDKGRDDKRSKYQF